MRLEECKVPDPLKGLQWVNLYEETGYERLRQALELRARELGLSVARVNVAPAAESTSEAEADRFVTLIDVTPLALGVETVGGLFSIILPQNTPLPTRHTETFTTAVDDQTDIEIRLFVGTRWMARDNRPLGRFIVTGIPPEPRGSVRIEVIFDVDSNGILTVAAREKVSGHEQEVKITNVVTLSRDEVRRMLLSASDMSEEERLANEKFEAENNGIWLVYRVKQALHDHGGRFSPSERSQIEGALKEVNDALSKSNAEDIKRAVSSLAFVTWNRGALRSERDP